MDFDQEIRDIIACKKEYEEKFGREIPVVVAGGIFDRKDIDHAMALGRWCADRKPVCGDKGMRCR